MVSLEVGDASRAGLGMLAHPSDPAQLEILVLAPLALGEDVKRKRGDEHSPSSGKIGAYQDKFIDGALHVSRHVFGSSVVGHFPCKAPLRPPRVTSLSGRPLVVTTSSVALPRIPRKPSEGRRQSKPLSGKLQLKLQLFNELEELFVEREADRPVPPPVVPVPHAGMCPPNLRSSFDGWVYTGGMLDGAPEGQGTYSWPRTGEVFTCNFRRGYAAGHGVFHWRDGRADVSVFEGGPSPRGGTLHEALSTHVPIQIAEGPGVRWNAERTRAWSLAAGVESGLMETSAAFALGRDLGLAERPPIPASRVRHRAADCGAATVSWEEIEQVAKSQLSEQQCAELKCRSPLPFDEFFHTLLPNPKYEPWYEHDHGEQRARSLVRRRSPLGQAVESRACGIS